MNLFKKRNEKVLVEEVPTENPYEEILPYLVSEQNNGGVIGGFQGKEVRMDLFDSDKSNPNLAVLGYSSSGKTVLLQNIMRTEDKDINRYVIKTRGADFEDAQEPTIMGHNPVVNPFHIMECSIQKQVEYVVGFFVSFGALTHSSIKSLDSVEQAFLKDLLESFVKSNNHVRVLTISKFKENLLQEDSRLEQITRHHMNVFTHSFDTRVETPYEFYVNYPEYFKFIELLNRIGVVKKILGYIFCMESMDVIFRFHIAV